MEDNILRMTDENGVERDYEILFDFHSDEFNKSYMVVTPLEVEGEETQIMVTPYSFTLKEDGTIDQLFEIETQEEFELIKEEFENMLSEMEHDHGGCGCHHGDEDDDHECCGGHHHHDDEDEEHECCGGHHHK